MNHITKFAFLLSCIIILISCSQTKIKKNTRPNVIILLCDDAGYADFGFAGSKDLKTPNIDNIASNGVVFTDAHVSASVCGPSRAGILTGRYQQRFGFECNPDDTDGLDLNQKTLADAMKSAGYATAAFGKWHLGSKKGYKPNDRGFDYFWGFLSGGRSYFANKSTDTPENTHCIRENDQFTPLDGYLTNQLGEKAADFIETHKNEPFFIYWAPNAVHTPMEYTAEDMALFEGHPRQKLAAMTWALDRAVGKIISKLKKENLLDNTLVFFLSDNGGAHNNQSSNYPLKGFKGNKFEGGIRVPFVVSWPAEIKAHKFEGLTSSLDIFASCINVAGIPQYNKENYTDGVNLIPFLKGDSVGEPHAELFWRKDKMAAGRIGDHKLIKVDRLGYRLYQLEDDLGETKDLKETETEKFKQLKKELKQWESEMSTPLWTEGQEWDTITWLIHKDLYQNLEPKVKNPEQLKAFLNTNRSLNQ
ncbi:sulfatase-like hydrolase/transferase [Labilibaculum sp.]|uniref:sulfatase-like hydrolase/transferase n=1 Tax=Labilibaculum sp. TaxID=2060723 RepID=UPI003566150A